VICIDTMIVIWGVQKKARPGQEQMVERTSRWLRSLPANERLMIPSVAVAEYLQHFKGVEKATQLKALEQVFFVSALDLASAALASELIAKAPKEAMKHLPRETIKSDCYILATAIVHGAALLVTENRDDFVKLAGGRIRVEGVPEVPEQLNLVPAAEAGMGKPARTAKPPRVSAKPSRSPMR
jgi:predicted nucleic acid-binding protein